MRLSRRERGGKNGAGLLEWRLSRRERDGRNGAGLLEWRLSQRERGDRNGKWANRQMGKVNLVFIPKVCKGILVNFN